jgi:CPA1 family monovalent cation:H+ antiporter
MALSAERLEVLLLVAAIVAMVARRLRLPYTVGLVVAGIGLALLGAESVPQLTREMVFTAFLPPLIFEAALHMNWKALRRDMIVVGVLATLGVVVSAGCIVLGMHFVAGWSWEAALLFGVLISATDPVSVIATFKEAKVGGRLHLLMESESLFNDGTVAVLFGLALATVGGGHVEAGEIPRRFLVTVVGGITCGGAVSALVLLLAGRTTDHLVEITFTTAAAYGSFLVAEHFGLSGVMATMTAGVLVGNVGPAGAISIRGREEVASFWEYAAFVANSLVFLLIGARLTQENLLKGWLPVLIAIGAVILGRALSVYGCSVLWHWSAWRVRARDQHMLFWGGLRGALALALALGLPSEVAGRDNIVMVAFGVVTFSVLVQGLTIVPLLRRSALTGPGPDEVAGSEPGLQPAL